MKIISQIISMQEVAKAGQDYYFKKYQQTNDREDYANYKEYQGEEQAYQRVLDILTVEEEK